MNIGPFQLANNLFVAPMAGVTDRPFRMLCKRLGAGYAVSEMVTSRRELWTSLKTSRRANHDFMPALLQEDLCAAPDRVAVINDQNLAGGSARAHLTTPR